MLEWAYPPLIFHIFETKWPYPIIKFPQLIVLDHIIFFEVVDSKSIIALI